MYLTAGARHEKDPHLYFTGVLCLICTEVAGKFVNQQIVTQNKRRDFFSFKKGPPTFQCNETPPIPQTLLIHIYSTLMLIYTLSWCMQTFIQYPLLWGDKTVAPTQRKSSCSFDTTPRHPGYTAQPPQGWTCSG